MRRQGKRGDSAAKAHDKRDSAPSATGLPDRVLHAATRLISRRGFGAISLNDVAQEVGISKQALLYHYPSREALHVAVVDSLIEISNKHLLALLGVFSGKGEERLEQAMAKIREFFDTEPNAARLILRELLDEDSAQVPRLVKGVTPWLRLMADALRQGQHEGRVRPELDPDAAVAHVGTLLIGTFALLPVAGWLQGASDAEWRERRLGEVVNLIEHYLFTDADRARRSEVRPSASRRQAK